MSDRAMSTLRQRWPLAVAAAVAIVTAVWYAMVIRSQGNMGLSEPVPVFVVGYLAVLAISAGMPASVSGRMASGAAALATGGLLAMGILGIFSIGLPLLLAAGFAAWGLVKVRRAVAHPVWQDAIVGVAAAALSLVLLVLP